MRAFRTLLVPLVAGLLASGCASSRPATGPQPAQVRTTVQVTNHNWADMVVYAIHNGLRVRLGMVTSMTTRHLPVPRNLTLSGGDFRLAVDPIGSTQGFVTQPLQIRPGSRIEFNIQNNLPISTYSVWE